MRKFGLFKFILWAILILVEGGEGRGLMVDGKH